MQKKDVCAYMKRFIEVNDAEIEEMLHTSIDERFAQTSAMMKMAELFAGHDKESREDRNMRRLWNRLRKKCCG